MAAQNNFVQRHDFDMDNCYRRYEQLKAQLTARAFTENEYEAACRKAAQLAGI